MKTPFTYDRDTEEIRNADGHRIGRAEPASGPDIVRACNCHDGLLSELIKSRQDIIKATPHED